MAIKFRRRVLQLLVLAVFIYFYYSSQSSLSAESESYQAVTESAVEGGPPEDIQQVQQVYKLSESGMTKSGLTKVVFQRNLNPTLRSVDAVDSQENSLLFLTILNDANSFGGGRTFKDFLEMLSLIQPAAKSRSTLGFLVSDWKEFQAMKSILESQEMSNWDFAEKITLLHQSSTQKSLSGIEERHSDHVQFERRQLLAVLRNTLLYSALDLQEYVVWIDADIFQIPADLIPKMISSGKDIITPKCVAGPWFDYDGNAWVGKRSHPTDDERERMKSGKSSFVPRGGSRMNELDHDGSGFIELDSVGGTFLFVKGEVFRQGIAFPPYYVIGADWDLPQGWDGIETEGLCYIAKTRGYRCWGMPLIDVQHIN